MIMFKSKVVQDFDVLKDFVVYVLGFVGKQLGECGVIMYDELDYVIVKLEGVVVQVKQECVEYVGYFYEDEVDYVYYEVLLSLVQCVVLFLMMLCEVKVGQVDVYWGF